jgi:hypothetical protein
VPGAAGSSRHTADEEFVTALLLDIPDSAGPIGCLSCGHPPPGVVRDGRSLTPALPELSPPLGLGFAAAYAASGTIAWARGDLVLLCTDGVLEARNRAGVFYPLLDRIRSWPGGGPGSLVSFLRSDLLRYTGGGRPDDEPALVAFRLAG